jgi:hypothetical protein
VSQTEGRVVISVHAVDRASANDAGSPLLLFAVWSSSLAESMRQARERRVKRLEHTDEATVQIG